MIGKKSLLILFILLTISAVVGYAEVSIAPGILEPVGNVPADDEENVYFKTFPIIAVDKEQNVYAFYRNDNIIFKMTKAGKLIKNIGREGQGPGDLFKPSYMKTKADKIFVVDSYALSIFSLDGIFKQKFRIFSRIENFDLFRDKIVMLEIGKNNLFNMYTHEGKRVLSFGNKYRIDYSKFKGFDVFFLDEVVNQGKVICDENHIFFISFLFGDIFKYDEKGNFVKKGRLTGLDDSLIKKNIQYYFIKGAKIDNRRGKSLSSSQVIMDAECLEDGIYILTSNSKNNRITVYDKKEFQFQKEYIFYKIPGKEKGFAIPGGFCIKEINGNRFFYISIYGEESYYISLYKIKRR